MLFTPDRKRAFIHGVDNTSILHFDTLEQPGKPIGIFTPHSGYFTPDQKRAVFYFASAERCCAAAVVNMETEEMMKAVRLGGIGIRIAEAILAVGATAASFADAQASAKRTGASSFYYSVYTPRGGATVGRGPLVMGADGKFAYAVDAKSNRITTLDLTIGDRLKTDIDIKNGAREMVALRKGAVLAVMGEKGLTFIDPVARTVIAEQTFPGELRRVELSEDGERAIAVADGRIAVFDAAGKVLAENTSVAQPNDWILLK
jgi:hypothetical protein